MLCLWRILFSLLCLAAAASARNLDAPQSLTLTALEGKVWRLTWDPILDDQLMGYSVFSRRGKGEYTKITKIPVTEAMFKFKGLDDSRPVEMVVAAEYEDGRSDPSAPVFSRFARSALGPPSGDSLTATAQAKAESPSAESAGQGAAGPKPELGLGPTPEVTPFAKRPLRDRQSMLAPKGQWRSSVEMQGRIMTLVTKGYDYIQNMPWYPSDWYNYDLSIRHNWEWYLNRVVFRVPLSVKYGLFPGFEAGFMAPFDEEFAKSAKGTIDGKDYSDTTQGDWPEFNTSQLGDVEASCRLQIVNDPSLIVGITASFPTGVSRFKSMLDYFYDGVEAAGNGLGVPQATVNFLLGEKGLKRGLHLEGSFTPGTAETVSRDIGGVRVTDQAIYGDRMTFGGGFTLPWEEGRSSVVIGVLAHYLKADKWIFGDQNIGSQYDRQISQPYIRMLSGMNLYDDNQLEAYVEVNQDVRLMTLTGKLQFINQSDGYTLGISGGFIY